jgi:hypothetical protein
MKHTALHDFSNFSKSSIQKKRPNLNIIVEKPHARKRSSEISKLLLDDFAQRFDKTFEIL